MKLLLDSDSIIFKCGFAVEHKKYKFYLKGQEHLGPFDIYNYKRDVPKGHFTDTEVSMITEVDIEPLENCLYLVKSLIETILQNTQPDSYQVYIKGKSNFREAISKTRIYKGNRDIYHRPRYEKEIREYLKTQWGAEEVDGQEVDDKVCQEQWALNPSGWNKKERNSMVASADKDCNQIPGWHYDYHRHKTYWITEHEAEKTFYEQLLSGDSSDNIQGIEGIGSKGARKILRGCKTSGEMFAAVQQAYKAACGAGGIERLTEMAHLVYLRKKEGEAWQPPK